MKKYIVLLLLLASIANSQEVSKVGTTAAKFLSIPVSPRALGMGGAFVSVADDPSAMYWNAAGAARLVQNELLFDHAQWFADIGFNYAAIVMPFGTAGNIGINVTSMTTGQMDVTTETSPEGTGESFAASSYAFGFTYAKNLTEWFSIGSNVKYVTEKIWHSSSSGVGIDIGTLFNTPFSGIRFGASISNFGSKLHISGQDLLVQKDIDPSQNGNNPATNAYLATEEFDMPLNLRIGISKDFISNDDQRLILAIDASQPNDNTENVNVGGEYQFLGKMLSVRGGYKALFMQDSPERFTVGGGLNQRFDNRQVKFDYAFEAYDRLSGVHKFSFGILF